MPTRTLTVVNVYIRIFGCHDGPFVRGQIQAPYRHVHITCHVHHSIVLYGSMSVTRRWNGSGSANRFQRMSVWNICTLTFCCIVSNSIVPSNIGTAFWKTGIANFNTTNCHALFFGEHYHAFATTLAFAVKGYNFTVAHLQTLFHRRFMLHDDSSHANGTVVVIVGNGQTNITCSYRFEIVGHLGILVAIPLKVSIWFPNRFKAIHTSYFKAVVPGSRMRNPIRTCFVRTSMTTVTLFHARIVNKIFRICRNVCRCIAHGVAVFDAHGR